MTQDLMTIAEKLQDECHEHVMALISDKVSYSDAKFTWMYKKLAEYELRIMELESCKHSKLVNQ